MDRKIDLRIIRTHKLIKAAFLELLDEIGFERITIQNLSRKAMVSRTTFYIHYKDKYDLLEQIENELLDGFKCVSLELPMSDMAKISPSDEKGFLLLVKIYEHVGKNHQFFNLLMDNPSFSYKMGETMEQIVAKNLEKNPVKIPEYYAVSFIAGYHNSIMRAWLKNGMKETPYEIARMIGQIMQDVPKRMYS